MDLLVGTLPLLDLKSEREKVRTDYSENLITREAFREIDCADVLLMFTEYGDDLRHEVGRWIGSREALKANV